MKILKFGGTSVGSPQRMKDVCKLITDGQKKSLSSPAMSGTTNTLVEIADYFQKKNAEAANNVINKLCRTYMKHVEELYETEEMAEKTKQLLNSVFSYLHSFQTVDFSETTSKAILAQGEIMSTNMVTNFLMEQGVKVHLIPAFEYMRLDEMGEPDMTHIQEHLSAYLRKHANFDLYITQDSSAPEPQRRSRQPSAWRLDYTARLIGATLQASEIQIWTDIDGMHEQRPPHRQRNIASPSAQF